MSAELLALVSDLRAGTADVSAVGAELLKTSRDLSSIAGIASGVSILRVSAAGELIVASVPSAAGACHASIPRERIVQALAAVLDCCGDESCAAVSMGILAALVGFREPEIVDLILAERCLKSIIAAMERHRRSSELVADACCVLCIVASPPANRGERLAKAGAVPAILAGLNAHVGHARAACFGANALGYLAPFAAAEEVAACEAAIMAALRTHDGDAALVAPIMLSMRTLTQSSSAAASALVAGGHAFPVLALMRRYEADIAVSVAAALLLCDLAAKEAHHTQLVVAGAVPALLTALQLHEASPVVVVQACRAMFGLAKSDPATQLLLGSAEVAGSLLALLRRYVPSSDSGAVVAVLEPFTIIAEGDSDAVSCLVAGGVRPLLLEALQRHGKSTHAARNATLTLTYLAKGYDDRVALASTGATKAAVQALVRHGSDLRTAQACLLMLCKASDASSTHKTLVADGAFGALPPALLAHYTNRVFAEHAVALLYLLCSDMATMEKLQRSEAAPALAAALRQHGRTIEPLAHDACTLLVTIARHDGSRRAMVTSGCIEPLVAALAAHTGSSSIAFTVCEALYALLQPPRGAAPLAAGKKALSTGYSTRSASAEPDVVAAIVGAGGVPVVAAALDAHADDAFVARFGCDSLAHVLLGLPEDARAPLVTLEVISVVTKALRRHKDSSDFSIIRAGAVALQQASEVPSAWPHFVSTGAIPLLVALLRLYGGDERVVGCLAAVSGNLAQDGAACELMVRMNVDKALAAVRDGFGRGSDARKHIVGAALVIAKRRTEMEKA